MNNYEKNERTTKILSAISLVSIIIGIFSGILSVIFENKLLDTIAVTGLTVFMLPVLVLQVAMPANFHIFGTKGMGTLWSLFFFLFIFPFADLWFFSGVSTLFNIIPNYHSVMDRSMKELVRNQGMKEAWTYIGSIYVVLISIGLLLRKKPGAKIALV